MAITYNPQQDKRRRQRRQEAREWCAHFLPSEHLDVGAMTAMLLREVHGPGKVTAAMVLDRAHKVYGVQAAPPPGQLTLL